jgi:hypothetical protein
MRATPAKHQRLGQRKSSGLGHWAQKQNKSRQDLTIFLGNSPGYVIWPFSTFSTHLRKPEDAKSLDAG